MVISTTFMRLKSIFIMVLTFRRMLMSGLLDGLRSRMKNIPVVDIHTHINPEKPWAEEPETILLYHYIVTELATAGVSRDVLERRDMPEVLRNMRLIRNTSTYWCLLRILRDLYGLDEEDLSPERWNETRETMKAASRKPEWVRQVLKKAGVKKVFLTMDYASPIPSYDRDLFVGGLRVDPLISRISKASIDRLGERTGIEVSTSEGLSDALAKLFDVFRGYIRTVTVSLQPEDVFKPPDRFETGEALKRMYSDLPLREEDVRAISSYVVHEMLTLCKENDLVFQLMLGVRRPVPGASPPDYAIVVHEKEALTNYCRNLFSRFREVRFDLIVACELQTHEVAVVAKNYPNVYFSGFWWYSFYPSIIRRSLTERLQILPRNKVCGFFSDAYVVEWIYGKLCLVKEQIAHVLAEMVEQGYYSRELAYELAEDLLYRNPVEIYRL